MDVNTPRVAQIACDIAQEMLMTLAQSEHLTLRRLTQDDVANFRAYRGDPDVAKFQGWDAMDEDEAVKFLGHMSEIEMLKLGKWTQLGIALRDGNVLIGDIGVHIAKDGAEAELGITLARSAQGHGLGFEAVEMICDWLFAYTSIERIVAITHAQNERALVLLARSPFQHTHDTNDMIDGTLTPERWFERRRS
jgi:RimJ/RimL family protein N-acetyltransferase